MCPGYINVTDGQTDGRTTYDSNTALALRASRGKKLIILGRGVQCALYRVLSVFFILFLILLSVRLEVEA